MKKLRYNLLSAVYATAALAAAYLAVRGIMNLDHMYHELQHWQLGINVGVQT